MLVGAASPRGSGGFEQVCDGNRSRSQGQRGSGDGPTQRGALALPIFETTMAEYRGTGVHLVSCGPRLARKHEACPQIREHAGSNGPRFSSHSPYPPSRMLLCCQNKSQLHRQGLRIRYCMIHHVNRVGSKTASSAIRHEPTSRNLREPQCSDPPLFFSRCMQASTPTRSSR